MSECAKHQWYAPTGTYTDIHPPCPWCQLKIKRDRISTLEKAAKDQHEYLWALTGDLWPQNETTKELERYLGEWNE